MGESEWCEHWKQVVWFLPRKGLLVSSGEEVVVSASHDAISVSYNVMNSEGSGMLKDETPKHIIDCPVLFEASMTPDRIGILGHEPWREGVRIASETAVRFFTSSSHFTFHHRQCYRSLIILKTVKDSV
jgi:protein arginine N-methyltransferase 7